MKRKHALAFVIILSITTTSLFSFADTAKQINDQLQEKKSEQKKYTNQINAIKKEEGKVLQRIQTLEKEIDQSEEEIESLKSRISTTEANISNAEKNIAVAEENIENKQDVMGERVDVMYRNGTIGYAEVLLNSKNLTDLLTNLDMVKKIVNHDVELLKEMKTQRDIIEEEKIGLENQKQQLVSLKSNVEKKQQMLVVSRGEQESLRKDLAKDKVAVEKMLDETKKKADELTKELRSLQSTGDYVGGELQWPVPGYTRVTSPFGNRIHPILQTKKFHTGIDIAAPSGKNVVAAGAGKVITAGTLGSYGKAVIIDHGGGIMTLYAHNSKLLVSNGDTVTKGQGIALIGSTGASTGPHLHFEVRKNGQYVNPIPYVKGK